MCNESDFQQDCHEQLSVQESNLYSQFLRCFACIMNAFHKTMFQSSFTGNHDVNVYNILISSRQGKFIDIAHFIHSGNSKCFT